MIRFVNLRNETGILRASIALQFVLATAAIGLGLTFGASSILFDGVSSFVEAGMAVLSLMAVTLIRTAAVRGERGEQLRRRYNMGVWHFEPFAVALRGLCLVGVLLDGTRWAWGLPYLDPGILALVSIVILPLPIRDLREAFRYLFRVAPATYATTSTPQPPPSSGSTGWSNITPMSPRSVDRAKSTYI